MFDQQTYIERRRDLKYKFDSGLLLFLGNNDSPANYLGNTYAFRQDSTFLYYFGLNRSGLAALIDVDSNTTTLFGTEFTLDDKVWMGPQPTLKQIAEKSGIDKYENFDKLFDVLSEFIKTQRKIHFLPQYRSENIFLASNLLGLNTQRVNDYTSSYLIKAVISQRSIKSKEEIGEIDKAVDIAFRMHTAAMKMIKPGLSEKKIAGMIEGIALSLGAGLSFRPIVSINGQILHNHFHGNDILEGSLVVNDSGAETNMHYASDITRTIPANGKFTQKQKEIYEIVLNAETSAISAVKPGVMNKDLHLLAAKTLVEGLSNLGLMHGSVDEAVQQGAHALFFPHGLGHMMGLDVHDLEGLGEDFVGYNDEVSRSDQFGLAYLRLAKSLSTGNVFTIEPGIYFIQVLIDQWKGDNKFPEFINYDRVDDYRDFGGIRIEDDILVTEDGYRILGKPIPKTVDEVEAIVSK
ncbi:MAG: aminopeptidase P family protein [Bacteroidetes bacterium]|nr:aminopeptidase P family protein [Bacteroidota bacterium]